MTNACLINLHPSLGSFTKQRNLYFITSDLTREHLQHVPGPGADGTPIIFQGCNMHVGSRLYLDQTGLPDL